MQLIKTGITINLKPLKYKNRLRNDKNMDFDRNNLIKYT